MDSPNSPKRSKEEINDLIDDLFIEYTFGKVSDKDYEETMEKLKKELDNHE